MPEGEAHLGREYEKNEWGGGKRCREGDGMGDRCETEMGERGDEKAWASATHADRQPGIGD